MKDQAVRRNIQVISARLYDLRERFMTIIQKINNEAASVSMVNYQMQAILSLFLL